MGRVWRISTSVAWRLLDACVLSILDYSAIIFCNCIEGSASDMDGTRFALQKFYKQVILSVCAPVRSTPYESIYYHLGTMDFTNRWNKIAVQYFSHLLRVPKSGCLYMRMMKRWWPVIQKWSRLRWKPTSETAVARTFRTSHIRNNHIYKLIKVAIRCEFSDLRFINYLLDFGEINHKVSYYVDYTEDWKQINWIKKEFQDEDLQYDLTIAATDMLIFTDGSVDRLYVGYGFCAFTKDDYSRLCNLYSPDEFLQDLPDDTIGGEPVFYQHQSLSARSSIDYCEAMAIFDSVLLLAQKIENDYLHFKKPPDILTLVRNIRIITDSHTVLKWLTGVYRIKSVSMKQIINDIQWNVGYIEESGYKLSFQHSPAHTGVFGNELADRLAKRGSGDSEMRANTTIKRLQFENADNWRYINHSAVAREIRNIFYTKQLQQYQQHRKCSLFGKTNGNPPILSRTIRVQRLKRFNRLEFRWILAISTGHDWFRQFRFLRFKKGSDGRCDCCDSDLPQNISHYLVDCTNAYIMDLRTSLITEVSDIYEDGFSKLYGFETEEYQEALSRLDWTSCDNFLFSSILNDSDMVEIIKLTISFLSTVKRIFLD